MEQLEQRLEQQSSRQFPWILGFYGHIKKGSLIPFFFLIIDMFTYGEVYSAFLECWKNKKKSPGAQEFLFGYQEKLMRLTNEINNRTYRLSPSTVFYIEDPKPREIFASDFRDRIVHHLVIRELMSLFESYFIPTSFSCMPGRGTLAGVLKMAEYMNSLPDPSWYVMKMDVMSFFMGIRKSLLSARLETFILDFYKDQRKIWDLVWLCKLIILSDPTKNCIIKGSPINLPPEKSLFNLPPDFGLPIGNYSSQVFANFYMTSLDLFITQTLGLSLYGRYVDDFMMYGPKDLLLRSVKVIKEFAKKDLGLIISDSKFYFQPSHHGIKFIGSVIKPGRIYAGNRVRGELIKKLYKYYPSVSCLDYSLSVFNSYLGLLSHFSSFRIRRNILEDLPNGWDIYFYPDPHYKKLILKSLLIEYENISNS